MPDNLAPEPPPNHPQRDFDLAEQKMIDQSRAEAETIRENRVKDLNADRPKPELLAEYTPMGSVVTEVHTPEAAKKNTAIDQTIKNYKDWMIKMKGKARDDFEKSR